MTKQKTLAILLIAVMVFVGASTASAATTIRAWFGNYHAGFEAMVEKFNQEHTDIKIEVDFIPFSDYAQKVIGSARTNQLPDLLMLQPKQPASYGLLGYLQPMNDVVGDLQEQYSFSEQDLYYNTTDGNLWGVPWHVVPHLLYYRTDWFAEAGLEGAPSTWDEFALYAKKLTTKERFGYVSLLADKSVGHTVHTWMAARGAETLGPNLEVIIDSPETRETLDFLANLYKDGFMYPGSVTYDMGKSRLFFVNSGAAMLNSSASFADNLAKTELSKDIGMVEIPKNGGTRNYYAFHSIAISKDCKDLDAAKEVISWMYKPENYDIYFLKGFLGNMPAERNYVASGRYWQLPNVAPFRHFLEPAMKVAQNGWFPCMAHGVNQYAALFDAQNIYQDMVLKCMVGGQTAEEAASWAQQQMEDILKRK